MRDTAGRRDRLAAARALERVYSALRERGTTLGQEAGMMRFDEFNELIGVEEKLQLAERFG